MSWECSFCQGVERSFFLACNEAVRAAVSLIGLVRQVAVSLRVHPETY